MADGLVGNRSVVENGMGAVVVPAIAEEEGEDADTD